MKFRSQEIESFKDIFDESKELIRAFPGVLHLELLQNQADPSIFFTYSHWETPEDLEKYRHSELFKATWKKTKPLFEIPAQAWSNDQLALLE